MELLSDLDTCDIDEANDHQPMGCRRQLLLLAPAPFRYRLKRLQLMSGFTIEREALEGAVQQRMVFDAQGMQIQMLAGEGLRICGAPSEEPSLVITGPGCACESVTLTRSVTTNLTICGDAWRDLVSAEQVEAMSSAMLVRAGRRALVVAESARSRSLRVLLDELLECHCIDAGAADRDNCLRASWPRLSGLTCDLIADLASTRLANNVDRTCSQETACAAGELIAKRVQDAYGCTIALDEISALLRVSRRSLQQAFERSYGVSFTAFVRAARLTQAHTMLRASGQTMTVAEIAMRCGFTHIGRFSQQYRNMFGVTPSTRRRAAMLGAPRTLPVAETAVVGGCGRDDGCAAS